MSDVAVPCSSKQCEGHISVLYSTVEEHKLLNRSLEEEMCILGNHGPIKYNKKAHLQSR